MDSINRQGAELCLENIPCQQLAEEYGTPVFVYSRAALENTWHKFDDSLGSKPHLLCYAVKANSNLAILNVLARLGSGFDIVSVGELERVLAAGGDATKTVFSGVGKKQAEMERALEVGIRCFNVESSVELDRLADVATAHGVVAPVSLRINPDVDAQTHPYISTGLKENKFGISMEQAIDNYRRACDHKSLSVDGIDCHIGSQLTDIAPYQDALQRLLSLVDQLAAEGITLRHIDVGGGQGIRYRDETPMDINDWATTVLSAIGERELEILVEPGRYLVGNAGLLLTTIEYLKHSDERNFCIVDAAMNDLIRPALYSAWQEIVPVRSGQADGQKTGVADARLYDVVGPVCESADFLGKQRELAVSAGEVLAVLSSGAYGFVMSSNYNSRPRAAEVMVDGEKSHLIRRREQLDELFAHESILPE